MNTIRWGIIGTGKIAKRFSEGLSVIRDAEKYAVASRSLGRAEAFARAYEFTRFFGSYEEMLRDEQVGVVYIASPHPLHFNHAKLALEAGKPVLCEKPLTINYRQGAELVQVAKEKRLFLMEALWTRFLPAIKELRYLISKGIIGDVKRIKADFSFIAPKDPNHRVYAPSLAGGALLDIGIYPINLAYMIMGEDPLEIKSFVHKAETGVDETGTYQFKYDNGVIAELSASFSTDFQKDAYILGTEGMIHIPLFWKASEFFIHRKDKPTTHHTFPLESSGLNYQAEAVMNCLREGLLESPIMPWTESLKILKTMDNLRAEWGLVYPDD